MSLSKQATGKTMPPKIYGIAKSKRKVREKMI
jgi:hypothetical protein